MTLPFKVESEHIKRLDDIQLTQLLKLLLHAEANKQGILPRTVNFTLRSNK